MHKLYEGGASVDAIASAYDLTTVIVDEVISVQSGTPTRFGWYETLHMLVDDPENAIACLEMEPPKGAKSRSILPVPRLTSRPVLSSPRLASPGSNDWLPLGHDEGRLTQVLNSIMDADKDAGPGGGKLCNVLEYPGGGVSVGIAMKLTPATPMTNSKAICRFELGRFGGEDTRRGAEQLERFTHRIPSGQRLSFGTPEGTNAGSQAVIIQDQSVTTCNPLQAWFRKRKV